MWPWPSTPHQDALEHGREFGLQVVFIHAIPQDTLGKIREHPNLLGNVWADEPTGSFWGQNMAKSSRSFRTTRPAPTAIAPNMRVFVNDVPWIDPPATEWWTTWNTAGDVSCHDNYPIKHAAHTEASMPSRIRSAWRCRQTTSRNRCG